VNQALPEALSPLHRPAALDRPFACLALISHHRHLAALGAPDPDRLVVSTDWLVWQQGRAAGHAIISFECVLGDWPEVAGNPDELRCKTTQWMIIDGTDPTAFHGVSLGAQLDADVAFLARAHHRQWHALDRLCTAHHPTTIALYDYRSEFDILDADARRCLVEEVAVRHGVIVTTDVFDPLSPDDPADELQYFGVRPPDLPGRAVLRRLYGSAVAGLFCARRLFRRRRPGIYLVQNWIVISALVDAVPDSGAVPVLVAEQLPKTSAFLWHCWQRGAILTSLPPARIGRRDRTALAAMIARIEQHWARSPPADAFETSLRELVRQRLFGTGLLLARARETLAIRRMFRKANVVRVVAGAVNNAQNRLVIETARELGIAVDEMLNGMFMTRERIASRNGDGRNGPLVDRLLSWGPQNEAWLAAIEAPYPAVRVGYAALDGLAVAAPRLPGAPRRALVLPLTVDSSDTTGLRANIMSYLVMTLDLLREAGFEEITVKLHPGTPNRDYFETTLCAAGHKVPVVKDGPLAPLVADSDIVVGPVNSGALVETAALGRPYVPIRAVPGSIDPALCGGIPVADGHDSLKRLLVDGPAAPQTVLDAFCDRTAIPNAAGRFWQVMNQTEAAQC
jgi:hypothetical protein